MRSDLLAALNEERNQRRAAILLTDLSDGTQRLLCADQIDVDPLREELNERLRIGKSGLLDPQSTLFALVTVPPPRLIVIGASHISQALAPMAKLVDLDMIIVDPRTAFASPDRFPNSKLVGEWPQDVLGELALDRYTAMVALAHEPRIDDPALLAAIGNGCFYIGALGSRKSHTRRLERLRAAGISDAALASIHAPIGLDIGAVTPAEIAVSIIAEIIAARQQKPLRSEKAA